MFFKKVFFAWKNISEYVSKSLFFKKKWHRIEKITIASYSFSFLKLFFYNSHLTLIWISSFYVLSSLGIYSRFLLKYCYTKWSMHNREISITYFNIFYKENEFRKLSITKRILRREPRKIFKQSKKITSYTYRYMHAYFMIWKWKLGN